jgi:hypothetical protein
MENLRDKILKAVEIECQYATRDGSSKLSVCDHSNWDKDLYNFRHQIIDKIRERGFNVSVNSKWGVLDIVTTISI